MPQLTRTKAFAITALVLAGCAWGTGFFFGKIALAEMSVGQNVAWRFIFGTFVFAPVLFRRAPRYSRRDWMLIGIAAFLGIPIQFIVQFMGLQLTTVSHAALMIGTLPVMLAITSAFTLHERLHPLGWLALLASTAGVALIASSSSAGRGGATVKGDLLVIVSMMAAVVMVIISKHLITHHDPLYTTALILILGAVVLLIWVQLTEGISYHHSVRGWAALASQGLIATTGAYTLWTWGLTHVPAARAGVFLNLEPVVGTILGIAFLGDRLGLMGYLGGTLVIGAAVYFSRNS